jgi:phosphatidylinositol-bisphosphatase
MKFTPHPTDENEFPSATTFTFVNAHLAAFDEMFEKRNADFHDLSKRLQFPNMEENEQAPGALMPPLNIYESDVLFWMVGFLRLDFISRAV